MDYQFPTRCPKCKAMNRFVDVNAEGGCETTCACGHTYPYSSDVAEG